MPPGTTGKYFCADCFVCFYLRLFAPACSRFFWRAIKTPLPNRGVFSPTVSITTLMAPVGPLRSRPRITDWERYHRGIEASNVGRVPDAR